MSISRSKVWYHQAKACLVGSPLLSSVSPVTPAMDNGQIGRIEVEQAWWENGASANENDPYLLSTCSIRAVLLPCDYAVLEERMCACPCQIAPHVGHYFHEKTKANVMGWRLR
jgi:hypothetical protein